MTESKRKAKSDTYTHPTTYREIVTRETKQHQRRLAALDDAADWIGKIEGDLQKVVAMGCLYSIREGSMELELRFDTHDSSSLDTFRALRISSGWMSHSDARLIDAFVSIGWVVESAKMVFKSVFATAVLWKPGTDIRIVITGSSGYLARYLPAPVPHAPASQDATPSSTNPTAF
jgi:hypothetical protein